MNRGIEIKTTVLAIVVLGGVGFSGCGGGETTQESPENIKATQKLDENRFKNMEDQYKNKKSAPTK